MTPEGMATLKFGDVVRMALSKTNTITVMVAAVPPENVRFILPLDKYSVVLYDDDQDPMYTCKAGDIWVLRAHSHYAMELVE